ncbi:33325_t:CDS:2, partial [Racocetra persica]
MECSNLPVSRIETDIPEAGRVFTTFSEIYVLVEQYAAKTNTILILGKTSKNPDGSGYRQVFFVCERQGKYGVNYHKKAQEYVITKSCLEHNHDLHSNATKFSTIMRKLDQNDLG